jgi:hypothetical protein
LQISPVIFSGGEWEPRAATVPVLPEAFLAVSWIFGGYYVFFLFVWCVVCFIWNLCYL